MAMKLAVAIVPQTSGFREWERAIGTESKVSSVKQAARLDSGGASDRAIPVENLEGDADIRGLVHNEPRDMYAVETEFGGYVYFGIV